jgi:predicted nucleotidyltransferase
MNSLFSSRARVEIMKLFLFNPENSYYMRQVAGITGQPIRAVQRELLRMEKSGLLAKNADGNRVYYRVNREYPVFNELKTIFLKTFGVAESLKKHMRGRGITAAFIYGSYAKNMENFSSDIDVFVIGTVSGRELSAALAAARKDTGREVNYYLVSEQEFAKKLAANDHFISAVAAGEKIFIEGDKNAFKALAGGRKAAKP